MKICRHVGQALCLALAWMLAACAISIPTIPANFAPSPGGELSLAQSVEVTLPTHYTRVLAEGSRWRKIGSVPQGDVYRAVGTVFTVEGRNVHEADLIVASRRALVGFYLPGESNVSMLASPVPLPVKENP
jgi:hypothetical protein